MKKTGAGGRPKAADLWDHVMALPGEKQVKCKHCGLEFAASANRIKSHILQIKGKGILICPNSSKNIRDQKEADQKEEDQLHVLQGKEPIDFLQDAPPPENEDAGEDDTLDPVDMYTSLQEFELLDEFALKQHVRSVTLGRRIQEDIEEKKIMEKSGAGGRPKAAYMWDHVTLLEGKKKVRCNYCGFEFAASANRIKSHINRVEGQGIRLCPAFPQLNHTASNKVASYSKEKQDLLDSQGLPIVDRPKNYNKFNERMLDCYMSPKTMWEGVKTPQQVLIHTEDMHQEKIKVGPFHVSSIENERDLQLIRYVFEHPMLDSYAFLSPRSYLYQHELTTLRPQTHLDSSIIDIFADILTEIERKKSKHLNWYLPVKFSNAAINSADVKSFLDFVQRHNMRDNYMSDLVYCEKIFIPVHVGRKSQGHYYLYIIQMKNYEVEIWDSLCGQFMDDIELDQTTKKLLLSMDILFGDGMFTKFYCRMASNIPLQPNGYDCGIFVINYMQQLDNYVRKKPLVQFDSDEERLDLALKLLKSDLNLIKEKLYDEAARRHDAQVESEGHLNLCGIKRKRVDTCKIKCQDVGRGAHMGWQNSNNRVEK